MIMPYERSIFILLSGYKKSNYTKLQLQHSPTGLLIYICVIMGCRQYPFFEIHLEWYKGHAYSKNMLSRGFRVWRIDLAMVSS